MMKKVVFLVVLVLVVLIFSAIALAQNDGFVPFALPTTADAPGTIFRIDKEGKRFIVGDITVHIHLASVAIPEYKKEMKYNIGFVCSILKKIGLIKGPALDASLSGESALAIKVEGAIKEYTTDNEVYKALKDAVSKLTFSEGNKYYIIRETVSAEKVTYTFDNVVVAQGGGSASIAEAAKGKANVAWRSGDGYILDAKFTTPHRILYKAEEIIKPSGGLGGGEGSYQLINVREPLNWIDTDGKSLGK